MNTSPSLDQMLVHTLPPAFVSALLDSLSGAYSGSYSAMMNDPALDEEEGRYVLGYLRRGRCETLFKRTAARFGLSVTVITPETGGCSHIQISNDKFKFSMCHVQVTAGFPVRSDNREQSSQINSYMPQSELFPIDLSPTDKKLYGIFVHTEQPGNKGQFQSVCIGFPNTNFDDWIYQPIDLRDIRDTQARHFQAQNDLHAAAQGNEPKFKESQLVKFKKPDKKE
ncbi:MAG: hypothetical protein ACI92E_000921 [Oceanicoccus sp.]|jgi:hypothetical protein